MIQRLIGLFYRKPLFDAEVFLHHENAEIRAIFQNRPLCECGELAKFEDDGSTLEWYCGSSRMVKCSFQKVLPRPR